MTDDANILEKEKLSGELTCSNCGAVLKFKPGTKSLTCTYCGADNQIEASGEAIEEIDYEKFIAEKLDKEEKIDVAAVRCSSCGASFSLDPNVTSDQCPYCASNIVIKSGSTSSLLKPKSLIISGSTTP